MAAKLDAWINAGLDEQQQADLFVADLVMAAREWVRTGKGKATMRGTRLADPTLADDMAKQEKWLEKEAKARGYPSIDELAEKNYKVFENLAALWRKKHPVEEALLSRAGYSDTIEALRQFHETEKRLGGAKAYDKDRMDGKTVLEYPQWVLVRRTSSAGGDTIGR